ncbi:MAG: Gfo/Idh/MocA family oxidoreductase [Dysgonamonadaceae bacterium]|jgi:predicted dehydrogenase|nr:Gfo/Idh/MocA family oxidoreductase [Dysgonamonadaceae bacterium]
MKSSYIILLSLCLLLNTTVIFSKDKKSLPVIEVKTPKRPSNQTDVIQLRCDPLPTVRVGFIGLGMRGPGAVERMTHIPGVEIVALCDVKEQNVKKVNTMLEKRGIPKAKEFYGDTAVWRKVTALPDIDLIYVATDWINHAIIGKQAMKDGKHVAIEVPAAMTLNEIWDLINISEQTRKHCMQLENCVYDFFELTTLNMVQQGLLGEIIHGEGAYIHGLQPYWDKYWENWRMDYNEKHRGDVYPTHGIGPVCQAMNIHRGDKLNFLVSVDTKAIGNPAYIKEKTGRTVENFRNGDHTTTLIRTENGKTILIEHDVTSPRPYNRMYQLTGTKGFANKYPSEGYALDAGEIDSEVAANHEKLTAHSFMPQDVKKALMEKYKHPIVKEIEETAKTVGGHGGMDYIMDYRLIYCLQKGLPLDMDVYDLAEWCCLIPLTELSLDNNSAPVKIPDFTRGAWNKLNGLQFAE